MIFKAFSSQSNPVILYVKLYALVKDLPDPSFPPVANWRPALSSTADPNSWEKLLEIPLFLRNQTAHLVKYLGLLMPSAP